MYSDRHITVLEDLIALNMVYEQQRVLYTILHSMVSKKTVISLFTTIIIYDTVCSVAGTRLHVLPTVMNDLLKEVEQIFKQHGDCEHCFLCVVGNIDFILFVLPGFE
jgi:hypothetical protein